MYRETNEDIASWHVRAGRRSYFFDVKATKGQDLFMTITESKRISQEDEAPRFEKRKIFLFKEDFQTFMEGFDSALSFIRSQQGVNGYRSAESNRKSNQPNSENLDSTGHPDE